MARLARQDAEDEMRMTPRNLERRSLSAKLLRCETVLCMKTLEERIRTLDESALEGNAGRGSASRGGSLDATNGSGTAVDSDRTLNGRGSTLEGSNPSGAGGDDNTIQSDRGDKLDLEYLKSKIICDGCDRGT